MQGTEVTAITDSDWKSWRIFVLKELERLSCNLDAIQARVEKDEKEFTIKIGDLTLRINSLEIRSGLFGAVSGSLSTIVVLLLVFWK